MSGWMDGGALNRDNARSLTCAYPTHVLLLRDGGGGTTVEVAV